MKKLILIVGVAVGYVLGARAGRGRYEQIVDAVGRARRDPRVQSAVSDVEQRATEAARQAAAKATETAQQAASRATEKVREGLGSDPVPDDLLTGGPVSGAAPERLGPDVPPPGSTS